MPGPFTHIYTQRRVADFLLQGGVTTDFIRPVDDALGPAQHLDPDGSMLDPSSIGTAMGDWPKFAALGAIGPDLFFFLQDGSGGRMAARRRTQDPLMETVMLSCGSFCTAYDGQC